MATKKQVSIICGKCKGSYESDSPYLIQHLFNYKNPDDSKSYYKICKKCLGSTIINWYDYDNILKMFETIDVPYIEKLWHESISLTNARLLQSNNNVSSAFSSSIYSDKIDDETLVIFTLIDEYFKKAKSNSNQNYFFNKSFCDSIEYMDSERKVAEKAIQDSINAMELKKQQAINASALLEEENKLKLLDEFGNFKVDLLSDNDYIHLSKKWGLKYNNYELVKLEEYWIKTFQSFEITTSTHQDLLLKIAKISLEIDNSIEKNEWDKVKDLSKLMNDLMNSANFTPKSKASIADRNFVSSVGELIMYIENKDGFIPRFDYKASRDIVDLMMENLKEHTKKLILNEVNLENIVEVALTKMDVDQNRESELDIDVSDSDDDEEISYGDNEDSYYSSSDLSIFMNALKEKSE